VDLFVKNHVIPQFKDVVSKYQPSVIFSDGEWDHPYTTWRSTELISWLLNESPNRDEVVINDRWGQKTRHHHGGYYTTEYGSGLNIDAGWEECRGIAHSFGYSRTENLRDYSTGRELIYMLIDIVSRGGNFLLDIGPTADGRIPVIMQERLLDMGGWLSVNGEAIYGTTPFEKSCQWSTGIIEDAKRGEYMVAYDIMKLTVNPDEGYATKEVFFTQKGDDLYCIVPQLPDEKLIIRDLKMNSKSSVEMLGIEGALKWKQKKDDVWISLPDLNPSKMPCKYAYVFKISGIKS
jgi:alpha-L-fucosidase